MVTIGNASFLKVSIYLAIRSFLCVSSAKPNFSHPVPVMKVVHY